MKNKGIALAGLLATVCVGLAACSSSSKSDSSTGPATTAGSSGAALGSAAPAGNTGGSTKGRAADACNLVSADQIAAALGDKIDPKPVSQGSADGSICLWSYAKDSKAAAGNSLAVQVISEKPTAEVETKYLQPARSQGQHIDGLGLPAYGFESKPGDDGDDTEGEPAQLVVDGGSSYLLGVFAQDEHLKLAQLVPIAKAALAH
jgi:hypothetical protein